MCIQKAEKNKPEEYMHGILKEMEDDNEIVKCARSITRVSDSHKWIKEIGERLGLGKQIYGRVMELMPRSSQWGYYIENLHNWIEKKQKDVEAVSMSSSIGD